MGRTCDARAQLCTDTAQLRTDTASSQMASGAPAAYQVRHEEEGGGDVKAEHGDEALEQAQLVACTRCITTTTSAAISFTGQTRLNNLPSHRHPRDAAQVSTATGAATCQPSATNNKFISANSEPEHAPDAWWCTSCDSHRKSHLRKEVPGVYSVPAGRCTMPRIWYLESR